MKAGPVVGQALVALIVLGVSAAVAKVWADSRAEPEPVERPFEAPLVRVVEARTGAHQLEVRALGEVVPRRRGALTAEVAGRVVELAPELVVGGSVPAAAALVRIDDRDLRVAKIEAEAVLADAAAALDREVAEAARAEEEWRGAGREGAPPPLVRRAPQLAQAEARVAAARAGVERAALDLERATVHAPFAARVRSVDVAVGAYVQRGQALATVYESEPMELRLTLTDRELERLAPDELGALFGDGASAKRAGPEVRFTTRFAGASSTWRGRLVRLEGEVDPISRMARLIADVDRRAGAEAVGTPLLSGLFVEASIAGRRLTDAVRLPARALVRAGEVLVVDREGRLERRAVEVLEGNDDDILVTAGLAAGERVVVSTLAAPVDGMAVQVELVDAPADAGTSAGPATGAPGDGR